MLSGYTRPVLVTYAPGGGRVIFIVEQTGKIKRATYQNGAWKKLGTFLDLSHKVNDLETNAREAVTVFHVADLNAFRYASPFAAFALDFTDIKS